MKAAREYSTRITAAGLCLAFVLASCAPDAFVLNEYSRNALYCRILTDLDSVEPESREFVLHGGGMAAVRNWKMTQSEVEFSLAIEQGREAIIYLRTVPVEYELSPALRFVMGTEGCRLEEEGRLLAQTDTIRAAAGQWEKVRVRNDGHLLVITVGCDVFYSGPAALPATEFMVMEAPPGARLRFGNFSYIEAVPEEDIDEHFKVKTGAE